MQDYEALATRSLDEPLTPDERAGLRVWADTLEWGGDPRGPLIALEYLLREQPERSHQLHRAINEHLRTRAGHLLGDFAPFVDFKRGVALEWRSGLLYSAFLDTRYLAPHAKLAPERLVAELVGAPMARTLRRLLVRVRIDAQTTAVMSVLSGAMNARRLTEIRVASGVRPRGIAPRHFPSPHAESLAAAHPDLWLLVHRGLVFGLPLAIPALPAREAVRRMLAAMAPSSRDGRAVLGRALVHRDPEVRTPALERLTELGPSAFLFVETLMLLLSPGLVTPQAPIAACLAALGERARIALPLLATITGRAELYDRETRRAAGVAIAALQA